MAAHRRHEEPPAAESKLWHHIAVGMALLIVGMAACGGAAWLVLELAYEP